MQGYGENLAAAGIPDVSVDAVIMTLVLCSVEDQRKCIKVGTILIAGSTHHWTCLCLKMAYSTGDLLCLRKPVLWIRICFTILVRIKFWIWIQGFENQNWKKIHIFDLKNLQYTLPYLSLGLYKVRPNNRRTLQPTKRTSSISKDIASLFLFFLWVIFAHPDPDLADQNNCGFIRIRIHNTAANSIRVFISL